MGNIVDTVAPRFKLKQMRRQMIIISEALIAMTLNPERTPHAKHGYQNNNSKRQGADNGRSLQRFKSACQQEYGGDDT